MSRYFEIVSRHAYPSAILWLSKAINSLLGEPEEKIYTRYYLVREPPKNVDADIGYPFQRELKKSNISIGEVLSYLEEYEGRPDFIKKILLEKGYLNISFDRESYARAFIQEFLRERDYPGPLLKRPYKVVVEHTSANPVHPMHVGHGRNTSLGDTIARMIRKTGGIVETRFYIDDVGRQTAILAYGLSLLGSGQEEWHKYMDGMKPDHWIGQVYAITHTLVELRKIRDALKALGEKADQSLISRQDSLVADCARLREKSPALFDLLAEKIMKEEEDPEHRVSEISISYERGEKLVTGLVRAAVESSLEGFRETLSKLDVAFDKWDWESELVWSGMVDEITDLSRTKGLVIKYKGAEAIDFDSINNDPELKKRLRIPERLELPPLILRRSDGTTLYTIRDIAYSIKKFEETGADYVINVVGKEQVLPQAQVRAALYLLGYESYAERLIHYSYEMVSLPGRKMSGRKGEYISLDDVLQILVEKARDEILRRRLVSEKEIDRTAEQIGAGALRYTLVSVSAEKTLIISYDDMVDFEKNTAPYIQYTHARASGILRKAGSIEIGPLDYSLVVESDITYSLLKMLSKYPYILGQSVSHLQPEVLVDYLWRLAQLFNKWYQIIPVITDPDEARRGLKLLLVRATKNILSSALYILGVGAPERM